MTTHARHFDYAMRYRPPSTATLPRGFTEFLPATSEHPFGGVRYDKALTSADVESYELDPLDPNHPLNLKREFETFRQRFMDTFSATGSYRIRRTHVVTESTVPGVEWQLTNFSNGTPTGHLDFTDFDELARAVWSIERQPGKPPGSTEQADPDEPAEEQEQGFSLSPR